jgi:hypothetical protein
MYEGPAGQGLILLLPWCLMAADLTWTYEIRDLQRVRSSGVCILVIAAFRRGFQRETNAGWFVVS